jgi:hypothetical protein
MDQNSTNDTEKRNWRERLGIGSRELPRLSGEFAKMPETISLDVKAGSADPARRKASANGAPHALKRPQLPEPQQQMPQGAAAGS